MQSGGRLMKVRSTWWRVLVVVGLVALIAAACGNDSGDSDDASDTSGDATIPTGPPVSGEPFNIGVIYTEGVPGNDLAETRQGAEAAAEYANAELGGIGGRPVEIVACNGRTDPAQVTECAQQFVDEGVIAVAGIESVWGDNGLPIIAEAGIPFVGLPISNAEFIGETSRPLGGGSLTAFPALAEYGADELGIESAGIVYADLAAGETAAQLLLADPLAERGVEDVTLVPESIGAADFTSAVVKATENDPDALYVLFGAEDCARVLQAAEQTGYTGELLGAGSCANPEALDLAGDAALEGFYHNAEVHYLAGEDEPEGEDAAIFRDRIGRYADAAVSNFAANAFSEVTTVVGIANQIAETQGVDAVTGPAVLAAIDAAAGDVEVFMAEPLDAANAVELGGVATGVYSPAVRIYQIRDGEAEPTGTGWVNGYD
jgi:branched-chain amino acid transport system substrate-binding protein